MPDKPFSEFFSEAINLHDYSLGQICLNLKHQGFNINKSTLMRWREGHTRPRLENMELIRHLPKALGLSESQALEFIENIGKTLGFNIAPRQKQSNDRIPLQYRKHLGGDVLSPFAGRQVDLSELQEKVLNRHSVMITGLGGVGKTRLAQELLQSTVKEFAHGCETLEISPGQTSLQVIRNVAYLLGMDISAEALNEASRKLVLEKIRQHISGISLIFLIDNVENAEQVRELVRALPGITWVFTARRGSLKNTGVSGWSLAPPSTGDAIDIFKAYSHSQNGQQQDLQEIVERLGKLPLALRLAASLLENGIVADPAELRVWLARKGLLSSRSLASKLRTLFEHLLENVPEDGRLLFEICGAFANPIIQRSIIRAILNKLEIKPSPEAWSALGDFSLVNFRDEANLELHPLVHEYAQLRLNNSQNYAVIWEQFKTVYLELAESQAANTDESQRAYHLFLPEEANLLHVVENLYQSADWRGLRRMGPVLEGYFWQSSTYVEYEKIERMCLQGAQQLGDLLWQTQTLAEIGFLKMLQEDWTQAAELFLSAQAISDGLPDQRFVQARIRRYRSLLAINTGQYEQAILLHEDVQARLSQLTNPPETQLDVAQFWLHTSRMEVYYRMGNLALAKAHGEIAGDYYRKINETGSYRARDYKVIFGDLLFSLGDINAAMKTWNEMLSFSDGLPMQVEEGDALSRLGWVTIQQEDVDKALELLEQARQIFTRYGQAKKIKRLDGLIESIETVREIPGFTQLFSNW